MPSPISGHPRGFPHELAEARAGSADALGRLLMDCHNYLLRTAGQKLGRDLQSKISPSDLVQDTFLEAQHDFHQFDGDREEEWLAWLCQILFNNLANAGRRYHATGKRAVGREKMSDTRRGSDAVEELTQDTPEPCGRAASREADAALEQARAGLPDHYQRVLRLRYEEQRTFAAIGTALNCSAEAARKLWTRAVDQLRKMLGSFS